MSMWDEINAVRSELNSVDQTVGRLRLRLEQIEHRQRALDREEKRDVGGTPPPLPAAKSAAPEPATAGPRVETPVSLGTREVQPAVESRKPAPVEKPAPRRTPPPLPSAKPRRRFGPPEDMSWEMALGTYWLPRIGVPLIAMAVVYGLTYISSAFHDAAWMPYARVGAGLALSGALLGIGWKLEKKYSNYARLLMGGGFGVLYFVVFATWYVPQTRIAPSQGFTLALLALLVAGWGAIAQWRQSRTVALFMTFMGHFTVALSTLTLDSPSRAAIGGLLALGAGSAWFLYRNGWYSVAFAAMAGSYLNQFFWLAQAPTGGSVPEFLTGMVVLVTYLLLFALAERCTPAPLAVGRERTRNSYCAINTGGFLLLGLALMDGFAFARPYDYLLYFATAGFGAAMGWSYAQRSDFGRTYAENALPRDHNGDPLASIYYTKASALVALGFAAWLDGPTVTLALALESLVLLLAARRTKRPVGRLLSLGVAVVAILHAGYTWAFASMPAWGEAGFTAYLLVSLAVAAVFFIVAEVYRVTPWHTFGTRPYRGPAMFEDLCRKLEMLPAPEGSRPLPGRMALAHMLVAFGVLMILGYADRLLALHIAASAVGVLSAAIVAVALARRAVPMLTGAAFLSGASILWWLEFLYAPGHTADPAFLPIAAVLLPLLAASELMRVFAPARLQAYERFDDIQGAWCRNVSLGAALYAAGAALVTGTTALEQVAPATALATLGACALAATLYAAFLGAGNLGLFALLVTLFSSLSGVLIHADGGSPWLAALGIAALACAATAVETRYWGERPGLFLHRLLPVPYVLYGLTAWSVMWFIDWQVSDTLRAVVLAGLAVALAGAMPWLHRRAMAAIATALLLFAIAFWLAAAGGDRMLSAWQLSAAILLAVALAGDRYFAWRKPFAEPWLGRILVLCAWVVCLAYNREMAVGAWHEAGLAFIALGFLAYAAVFRGGTPALVSLVTAVVATVPTLLKPASIVALGPVPDALPGADGIHYQTNFGLLLAYVALIVYWLCAERGTFITLARTEFKLREGHEPLAGLVLTAIPALLGVLCIARIDPIHDFYLTLSWTLWALALFGWALVTHQRWFRYMGLAVFGLALGRAFFIDIWRLGGLYRAGAMLALGTALLGVAYGYTRWRATQEQGKQRESVEEGPKPVED